MRWIDYVAKVVERYPDTLAVICHGEQLSYAQLWEAVGKEALRLRDIEHIQEGQYYVQACTQDIAYVVRFLALHLIGARCDILYTTGSTGKPKAVLLSDEGMIANGENLINAMGFHHGLTFVICGPLDHFGPWSKMLPVFMTGGTLHILDGLKDLDALFEAPMATSDMQQLREVLPNTRLYNTYASTETGIVCTYPYHLTQYILQGCVGPAMKHSEVAIGLDGEICVSGPILMAGYLNEDAEGNLHLEPVGKNFQTTDLGYLDAEGRLFLTGRSSEFINIGGLKLSPVEVEDAAMGFAGIIDCLCIPVSHPVMGQIPKLLIVLQEGVTLNKKEIARYLKEKLTETWKVPINYEVVEEIRKMPNGKKDRRSYIM